MGGFQTLVLVVEQRIATEGYSNWTPRLIGHQRKFRGFPEVLCILVQRGPEVVFWQSCRQFSSLGRTYVRILDLSFGGRREIRYKMAL